MELNLPYWLISSSFWARWSESSFSLHVKFFLCAHPENQVRGKDGEVQGYQMGIIYLTQPLIYSEFKGIMLFFQPPIRKSYRPPKEIFY